MGFYSWKTADTHQSIRNTFAEDPHTDIGPVYLLQPHGLPPIIEPAYEGYGTFGGVDANTWLAIKNLESEIDGLFKEHLGEHCTDQAIAYYKARLLGGSHFVDNDESIDIIAMEKRLPEALQGQTEELNDVARHLGIRSYTSPQMIAPDGVVVHNGRNGIPFSFNEPIPRYKNKSLNQLNEEDFFKLVQLVPACPLKFSFDKNAVYEGLDASQECSMQGYFDFDEDCGLSLG